jgi:Tfp pilus assembly protein PilF
MQSDKGRAWQLAQAAFASRQWDVARRHLEAAVSAEPRSPAMLLLLSYTYSYLGQYRAAREAALRAASMPPDSAETVSDIAARLRTFNEGELMVGYLDRLGPLSRIPIPLLLQCAAQFSYLNLQEEAHRFLAEALAADPDFPPTLVSMSQVLVYLGRGDEALPLLKKAMSKAPAIPEIYGVVGQLGKLVKDADRYMASALRLLKGSGLPEAQRAKLAFALHHMLDGAGAHEEAFRMLEAGCRLKRHALQYSDQESMQVFQGLKSLPTDAGVEAVEQGPMPIFIVGMHRSGTTLLEQLLTAHPGVRGVGELYDFTGAMRWAADYHCRGVIDAALVQKILDEPPSYEAIGRDYVRSVSWRLDGEAAFTDKLPSNFLNIGFIAQALPNAKILHMVRDPIETCFSNLRELFSDANPYSYDQAELADYYIRYQDLMEHWQMRFPGRICDVPYEELVSDTESTMRRVAGFCGIDFLPSMTDPSASKRGVSTASAVQVREGITRRKVPKWKPYEAQLGPMIAKLRGNKLG